MIRTHTVTYAGQEPFTVPCTGAGCPLGPAEARHAKREEPTTMGEYVKRARERRLSPADLTGQLYVNVTDRTTAPRERIVSGGRSYTVADLQRAMRKDDAR